MIQPAARFLVIGNPENRRVTMFQAALAQQNLPPACVVSYAELLRGNFDGLCRAIERPVALRLESPGENDFVERSLVTRGLENAPRSPESLALERDGLIAYERGEILPNAAWFAGYSQLLTQIETCVLQHAPQAVWMNHPAAIATVFDKPATIALLREAGLPTPAPLGIVFGYEELATLLREQRVERVFVKLCFGSSASGVIALRHARGRVLAITSVEMQASSQGVRLFNSLRVRRYEDEQEVAAIINALGPSGLYVERWLPKATWRARTIDLRVVVIAGAPRHTVVRMSRQALTNLHLGNQRGDAVALQAEVPVARWSAMLTSLTQAAALFPNCHYFGADVLFTPKFARHALLELNAFGDLLPNIDSEGLDTYGAEVASWCAQEAN